MIDKSAFIKLLKRDALDKANIIGEEYVKATLNNRFFGCYPRSNNSANAIIRRNLFNSSSSILTSINSFIERDIEKFTKANLPIFDLVALRDEILSTLDKYLKKLSFIHMTLRQELDSKPDYYPTPTVFRKREEARINEFIVKMSEDKLKILENIFTKLRKEFLGDEKNEIDADKKKEGRRIVVTNEYLNTTKYYVSEFDPNLVFLRVPYWFSHFQLYHPVVTHEIAHFLLSDSGLMDKGSLNEKLIDFIKVFNRELNLDIPVSQRQKLPRKIIEEVLIDVISCSVDGFGYLIALFLSGVGKNDRFYLRKQIPQLDPIPWTVRQSISASHLQDCVHNENRSILSHVDLVSELIKEYKIDRRKFYAFRPYKLQMESVTQVENKIEELIMYYFKEHFEKINTIISEYYSHQPQEPGNTWNVDLNKETLSHAKGVVEFGNKHNQNQPVNFEFPKDLDRELLKPGNSHIPNFMAFLSLYSIDKCPDQELINFNPSLGRTLRIFYDYIESHGEWQKPAVPKEIYEACFIKFRLDAKRTNDNDFLREPVGLEGLRNEIERFQNEVLVNDDDQHMYFTLGPFYALFVRPKYSPKKYMNYTEHPLYKLDRSAIYFLERKILARINNFEEEQDNEGDVFSCFIEIRLKYRGCLNEFYSHIKDDYLIPNKSEFKGFVIYFSLDWQDVVLLIKETSLEFISSIKKHIAQETPKYVHRTLTTVMYKNRKEFESKPISNEYPVVSSLKLKSGGADWARINKELNHYDTKHYNVRAFLTPGIFDYTLEWAGDNQYKDVYDFYSKISDELSDIRTDILLPVEDKNGQVVSG